MNAFSSGPFSFDPAARGVALNGRAARRWTLRYSGQVIAEKHVDDDATHEVVRDAFEESIDRFCRVAQENATGRKEGDPPRERVEIVRLVRSTDMTGVAGETIGQFVARAAIPGLTAGLIDDRFETWLVAASPSRALPMSRAEFERLAAAHAAIPAPAAPRDERPMRAWIAGLLSPDVLTPDVDQWRAPTSWELRHIVGEGSLTGVTGARAAALVGISPQNFRKYTAHDAAKNRQPISYAAWHLLLHKLGVQSA